MKDDNSILYVITTDNPEKQYAPLVLAQTAKMMDITPIVYYLGTGLKILLPGAAAKIKLGSFPNVAEMLKKTMDMGITIYACEASKQMCGLLDVTLMTGPKLLVQEH